MSVSLIEKKVIMDPVTFQPMIKANVEISAQVSTVDPFDSEGKTKEQFYQELGKQVYEAAIKPDMFTEVKEPNEFDKLKKQLKKELDMHSIVALDYNFLDTSEDVDMIITLQLIKNKEY